MDGLGTYALDDGRQVHGDHDHTIPFEHAVGTPGTLARPATADGSRPAYVHASLLRRWRQLGDQPKRDGELVQLEMGLEKAHGAIAARLAWNLGNLDARFLQRVLGL